jgi:hypothetical protein
MKELDCTLDARNVEISSSSYGYISISIGKADFSDFVQENKNYILEEIDKDYLMNYLGIDKDYLMDYLGIE